MDSWIPIIVVIALSAISSWVNKQRGGDGSPQPGTDPFPKPPLSKPPPREARPPAHQAPGQPAPRRSGPIDWEGELRRMLEGDVPAKPPARTPPPIPPKPVAPPARPQTIQRAPAPVAPRPSIQRPSLQRPPPPRPPAQLEEEVRMNLAKLSESQAAYQRGIQLHEHVGQRLQNVMQQTEKHRAAAAPPMRAVSAELRRTVTMLRSAQSARQALVASIIFAPPKSLEQQ